MKNLNERPDDMPSESASDRRVISMESHQTRRTAESPLIAKREMEDLRARWTEIQATFVDDPQKSVDEANGLVSAAMKHIEEGFRSRRSEIEKQLSSQTAGSTEDLRIALQQYRQFFDRLLSL